ncbi:sodium channel and clathrin linker 1 [Sorex fumeus]|uniref:sodium channel and clathrin linker 1 n=1 Tax=Sorex fumeus TaxID=62283 RepID=UPI0024AD881D|nr:sodium channel and clathrin linker 1 [Sorex fumeus]
MPVKRTLAGQVSAQAGAGRSRCFLEVSRTWTPPLGRPLLRLEKAAVQAAHARRGFRSARRCASHPGRTALPLLEPPAPPSRLRQAPPDCPGAELRVDAPGRGGGRPRPGSSQGPVATVCGPSRANADPPLTFAFCALVTLGQLVTINRTLGRDALPDPWEHKPQRHALEVDSLVSLAPLPDRWPLGQWRSGPAEAAAAAAAGASPGSGAGSAFKVAAGGAMDAGAVDARREPEPQPHEVLRRDLMENATHCPKIQKAVFKGDGADTLEISMTDQSFAPLVAEYENYQRELTMQLQYHQEELGKMKVQLESVIKENERLHSELKDAVKKQLEALPFDEEVGSDIYADDETVRNLQEQLQVANQEKNQAVELWQTASQELERLQRLYQEYMTKTQIHVAESQKREDQLTNFQQLTQQLHVTNENMEMTNQHFLQTISEQSAEISQLRKQLREAKLELRGALAKVGELTKTTGNLQEQMQKQEADVASARGREDASDRRLQQLQSSIKQLEARLRVALQDAGQLRAEKARLERQNADLQAQCSELQGEKFEAVQRARGSLQLLEEANLQKSQALLEEKHKEEDREKMREAMSRVLQDAAVRTRKEVMNVKKQYNAQLSQMTEELSALQRECAEKQSQIDRAIRERKAMEEELEKNWQQGRAADGPGRLEEMLGRWQLAERAKDELQLRLRTAESKMKRLEIDSSEEISRCQEMIQRLQGVLEAERESCGAVSEQRLRLQQENEQLQREAEELRRSALEAQKAARLKVSTMEQEFSVKAHGFAVQLQELEDRNRDTTAELRRLLGAQQKAAGRWREEARKLAGSTEARIGDLKSELSRQKRLAQELASQLQAATDKALENEQLLLEQQEKAKRLQRRLNQAEQRASAATQQLSAMTAQRRRAASMVDLRPSSNPVGGRYAGLSRAGPETIEEPGGTLPGWT